MEIDGFRTFLLISNYFLFILHLACRFDQLKVINTNCVTGKKEERRQNSLVNKRQYINFRRYVYDQYS